ncbi:GGDEF domain-containing protein [Bacillus carboniphilus]|uniref:GGDEF domain-containing protein n=1 Tax=Bacillus carboniphilus TaxID=86663 RepID=A0ABY9JXS3_9BACI|nr:GGDEF domain-containing protein [Bacillus carboniphilus]WLR44196.1 GGDEF domain-containing protein [Bacillus carboniphilus]
MKDFQLNELKDIFLQFLLTGQERNDNEIERFLSMLKEQIPLKGITIWKITEQKIYSIESTMDRTVPIHKEVFTKLQHQQIYQIENDYYFNSYPIIIQFHNVNPLWLKTIPDTFLEEVATICFRIFSYLDIKRQQKQETNREKLLIKLTEKIHSTMDKKEVLLNLYNYLQSTYNANSIWFYLSQDEDDLTGAVPISKLDLLQNELAVKTLQTGRFQEVKQNTIQQVYIPLIGKQGVYGFIFMSFLYHHHLRRSDLSFLNKISKAGGHALENAKLYEHLKKVNLDLQLINETSHHLNKSTSLTETVNFVIRQITHSFFAEEVGVILIENKHMNILKECTPFFQKEISQKLIHFVSLKMQKEREGMYIAEMKECPQLPYGSLMAVPMYDGNNYRGLTIALHKKEYAFKFEDFKLFQLFVNHVTLSFFNIRLKEELERLVKTDYLTNLFSRNHLNEMIRDYMMKDMQGAFLLFDLDNFKLINDHYGHQVGDQVLIQVSNIIKQSIRKGDVAARWGGEEIAVYLSGVDGQVGLCVANRIIRNVRIKTSPEVTLSAGVAHWTNQESITLKDLFIKADKSLYKAKEEGKNCAYLNKG